MGLPDTSPVPKKDWMGMDYIPVYESEEQDDGETVKVSLDKVQRSGVRTEAAIELDGEDLRPAPLEQRKGKLERLLARSEGIRFSEHITGDVHRLEAARLALPFWAVQGGGSIESQLTNSPPHTFMYPMLVARLLNRPVATR